MIGRPEWFTYRVFGWGLAPKNWKGYAYLAVFAALIAFITAITINNAIKMWVYILILAVLLFDIIHIMTKMEQVHDERENYHQLIIERNCSFAAIITLGGIALYQTFQKIGDINIDNNSAFIQNGKLILPFDISIVIIFGVMLFVKIASTIYVKNKK